MLWIVQFGAAPLTAPGGKLRTFHMLFSMACTAFISGDPPTRPDIRAQGAPIRSRQKMPFSTRRSSTRFTPRTFVGNNGSSTDPLEIQSVGT